MLVDAFGALSQQSQITGVYPQIRGLHRRDGIQGGKGLGDCFALLNKVPGVLDDIRIVLPEHLVDYDLGFHHRYLPGDPKSSVGYRSKFEARCAKTLGPVYAYEPFTLPYTTRHTYLPDFVNEAERIIVEAKGRFRTGADRAKLLAVKQQNSGWRFVIWFQNPELTISKRSKTSYRQWATANGFEVMP